MRKIAALLAAAIPLVAWSQGAPPGSAQPPEAPAQQHAPPPPQQYAPPPADQYTPPGQYAPPPQAPPPPQYPPAPQWAPPPQSPPPGDLARTQRRGPWYIGFALGGGNGSIADGGGRYSLEEYVGGSPTNASFNFKVGATLSQKLLLGFDTTAVRSQATYDDPVYGPETTFAAQITNYDAVATFFPMEKGLFVRAGAGLSALTLSYTNSRHSDSNTYTGVNVLGGVGYAFWLLRSFNLTVTLDVSGQSYGSPQNASDPESSTFWTLGVGCDWY